MNPLISEQATSLTIAGVLREDDLLAVWWGSWTECAVAISRLKREGNINDDAEEESRIALDRLAEDWTEVLPTDGLRLLAMLVSRDHHLKAADCLQLAAALRWCGGNAAGRGFVCLDNRLRRSASREGFDVLPELPEEEEAWS